jgi:hypothetical protein
MNSEMNMRMPTKTLAAALVAAALPFAVPAAAAPLSQPLALSDANAGTLDQVQYRRAHRRYYRSGWNAFARSSRSLPWNYGNGAAATGRGSWRGCPGGDRALSDAYPSYMCR